MIDVDRAAVLGEDLATGIGDRGEHVTVAEVDGPDEAVGRARE